MKQRVEKEEQINSLPSAYSAEVYESQVYSTWEESGFFNPDNLIGRRETFSIFMPPPNVTGVLHLGHAMEQALMDTRIRFERMRGKKTLLLPGTDHAAVATQARVEKDLVASGIKNPRKELGREELLHRIREYAEESKKTILEQMKRLGASCDWSRLVYTFDEKRSRAVVEAFSRMYQDGLIYRGYRPVNWSVVGQSTASDDELVYQEAKTVLYTLKYSTDFPIPVATTRPETKLGDTAVAVHPSDKRHKKYIGQTFTVDVGAAMPLSIRVIGDEAVDPEFGTGAVGVTPAHSMIDFEMKEKHNLDLIQVIGRDGTMTAEAGKEYAGLSVLEARQKFVATFKQKGLIIEEKEITHSVATSDRFGDVAEVLPMLQWFVSVNKKIPGRGKTLKELMREAGDEIAIKPERYKKVYYQWIDNLRDWCISRQIWWGHRVPVWYKKNSASGIHTAESIHIGALPPEKTGWEQDPDTLDTWFSSGLWTFSTLGWPESMRKKGKTGDLAAFHPVSWMQMGYEIVFFWMARMILMSKYLLDEIPFTEVYIHGLVRDKEGRKFSKSLRITLDPLEVTKQYGTDALRFALLSGVAPGSDISFDLKKVEHYQHFVNKLWNITRYIIGSVQEVAWVAEEPRAVSRADEWILHSWRMTHAHVTEKIQQSEFSFAAQALYDFTWDNFANWYLEVSKIERKQSETANAIKAQILLYVVQRLIVTLHPFAPFVTEVLWGHVGGKGLLMVAPWQALEMKSTQYEKGAEDFESVKGVIRSIRDFRVAQSIKPAETVQFRGVLEFPEYKNVIEALARCVVVEGTGGLSVAVQHTAELSGRKREELENYSAQLEKKLANKEFLKKAPPDVVATERKKLEEARKKLA